METGVEREKAIKVAKEFHDASIALMRLAGPSVKELEFDRTAYLFVERHALRYAIEFYGLIREGTLDDGLIEAAQLNSSDMHGLFEDGLDCMRPCPELENVLAFINVAALQRSNVAEGRRQCLEEWHWVPSRADSDGEAVAGAE